MKKAFVIWMLATLSLPQWLWAQTPVCEEISEKSKKSGSGFAEELRKTYPSCAAWLEKACLSSFRLDQDASPAKSLIPNTEGSLCFECITAQINPLGKNGSAIQSLMNSIKGTSDPHPPKAHQVQLVKSALAYWQLNDYKRKQDLATILHFFEKEKLDKKIRTTGVQAAVDTLAERVNAAAERAPGQDKASFQKFVADQIIDASQDVPTWWTDDSGIQRKDRYPGFHSTLRKEATDADRFDKLVERASMTDDVDLRKFDGNLTPYHAKMLLLYHFENSIRNEKPEKADAILNELASRLQLKADFTESGKGSEWKWIVPHDGFVLGASNDQINNLLSPEQSATVETYGTGTDCATFVHKMLTESGYSSLKKLGRMTSYGLATGGQLKGLADVQRVDEDAIQSLVPGDIIIKRPKNDPVGHVEIVVGYEGDPPQLVTVSAIGGYHRSIIKRKLNVYPDQPNTCSSDNYFTSNDNVNVFKASLKKGPP